MVKKERETIIKDGIVLRLLISKHQDKENIRAALLRHLVMKIWDNFCPDMDLPQAIWKWFSIKRKKTFTKSLV